ncbi:MAG: NAD(P)-binding domain-containing protein [Deltaproteobacteria bacterium]|nr:NAD(P)-binding domain-containing protein [Deltaproteobacteria bacterium]
MFCQFTPLGFIGAGYFAELIITKLVQTNTVDRKDIIVGVRRKTRAEEIKAKYGVEAFWNDNTAVCNKCNSIILAVRPNQVTAASQTIRLVAIADKLLISIVGAVKIQSLKELFRTHRIFRVNPNPQIQSGTGLTAYSNYPDALESEIQWVKHLFSCMSETTHLDEDQLNYISVLSGITHTLYYIECLMDAAHYLGLNEETAKKFIIASLEGSLELFKTSPEKPGQLIRKAATPGGIGAEKLYVLDKLGFKNSVIESMKSALEKANQLGT